MLYGYCSDVADIAAQHVVAVAAELEQKLIDLGTLVGVGDEGEDVLEDLSAILLILEDVSQEDHAFSQR